VILRLAVREIEPHHIDAGQDHAREGFEVARSGADGGYDFGCAMHMKPVSCYGPPQTDGRHDA
jgi:hypothetical protein